MYTGVYDLLCHGFYISSFNLCLCFCLLFSCSVLGCFLLCYTSVFLLFLLPPFKIASDVLFPILFDFSAGCKGFPFI